MERGVEGGKVENRLCRNLTVEFPGDQVARAGANLERSRSLLPRLRSKA